MAKKNVNCSECGNGLIRNTWFNSKNYFCDKQCKGKWQTKQRELLGFTKEWLISEYHEKGKSANQIAKEIGRDTKRVWEWIRDYGLDTRPRGTDYGQGFKKGQESKFKGKNHTQENKDKQRQRRLDDGRVPCYVDGVHWLHHYKDRKPASWKGGISPERQQVYSSVEWVSSVKEVWKRDNAICQKCGKHHNEEQNRGNFHIHHIVSFMVKELRTEVDNLILLCRPCHLWVHSNENINKDFIREY